MRLGHYCVESRAKTDVLMQASMKLGELVYKKQQEEAAAEGAEDEVKQAKGKTPDNVVDADVIDVSDIKLEDDEEDDKRASK